MASYAVGLFFCFFGVFFFRSRIVVSCPDPNVRTHVDIRPLIRYVWRHIVT